MRSDLKKYTVHPSFCTGSNDPEHMNAAALLGYLVTAIADSIPGGDDGDEAHDALNVMDLATLFSCYGTEHKDDAGRTWLYFDVTLPGALQSTLTVHPGSRCEPGRWDPSRPGDCLSRCIAYVLREDPGASTVPRPTAQEVEEVAGDLSATMLKIGFYVRLGAWLHSRGYHAILVAEDFRAGWTSFHWDLETTRRPLVIFGGPRVGDGLGHCVVSRGVPGQPGAEIVFNPSESVLEKVEELTFIVPIE